jgi:hypothetical protein
MSDEPEPLVLRHASKRSSGTWGPDDYDVFQDGRDIGCIFKPRAGAPEGLPWMWTITGAVVMPHLLSHGHCASLDEAKAKFAETWRAWWPSNQEWGTGAGRWCEGSPPGFFSFVSSSTRGVGPYGTPVDGDGNKAD